MADGRLFTFCKIFESDKYTVNCDNLYHCVLWGQTGKYTLGRWFIMEKYNWEKNKNGYQTIYKK